MRNWREIEQLCQPQWQFFSEAAETQRRRDSCHEYQRFRPTIKTQNPISSLHMLKPHIALLHQENEKRDSPKCTVTQYRQSRS